MIFTDSDGNKVKYDGSLLIWRVSAYAVIIENNKVFIVRSKFEKLFDLPGGSVEVGETIESALHREVKRSPSLRSGHQPKQSFGARNPVPNAIHPRAYTTWHSGTWAKEEAGLEIKIGKFINFHQDYFYHKFEKKFYQTLLLFFKAKIIKKLSQPQDKAIIFSQFIPLKDISSYPTTLYVKKIIKNADE